MLISEQEQTSSAVSIQHLTHHFGPSRVLNDLSLSIGSGEFVALLGPSGCGKSTLLKAVAGLLRPDAGSIDLSGRKVFDSANELWVEPEQRGLGMVFQDYALWPHMSVAGNIEFPLELRRIPPRERAARVEEALSRVHLEQLAHRKPGELSGGQQQRVGLARAIVARPQVLLFDEPLSNLDASLREALGREMATVVKSLRATAIYVTHDRQEALGLADRIAIMREGRLLQIDRPETIFSRPADRDVASFLQVGPLFDGIWVQSRFIPSHPPCVRQPAESPPSLVNISGVASPEQVSVKLLVPQSAVQTITQSTQDAESSLLAVRVRHCWFAGEHYDIEAAWLEGQPLLRWRSAEPVPIDSTVKVQIKGAALRLFHTNSGLPVLGNPPSIQQDQE